MNNTPDKKELILDNLENIPESYKEFMVKREDTVDLYYSFARRKNPKTIKKEYCLWCHFHLFEKGLDEKIMNFEILSKEDFYFKEIEGSGINITKELLKQSFVFGLVSSSDGFLFFHPTIHSVWEIYHDLYVRCLADDFDTFIKDAKFERSYTLSI